MRLRDQDSDRGQDPDAEDKCHTHQTIRKGGGGQRTRSDVTHHDRIDQAHQHLTDLASHDRAGQCERFEKLSPEASRVGHSHSPNQDFALWQVVAGHGLPIGEILSAVAFERRRAIFARDGSD